MSEVLALGLVIGGLVYGIILIILPFVVFSISTTQKQALELLETINTNLYYLVTLPGFKEKFGAQSKEDPAKPTARRQ